MHHNCCTYLEITSLQPVQDCDGNSWATGRKDQAGNAK